jgi:urease accessory protein UreH
MCGRLHSGERYRYQRLDLSTRILRPDGELIFCERQVVEPTHSDVDNLAVMGGMELFASVVIIAPADVSSALYDSITPKMEPNLSLGVHLLPSDAGIVCRIAGRESGVVKHQVRELCSLLRQRLYGVGMPAEFPWR